jgi:hypothetical protein
MKSGWSYKFLCTEDKFLQHFYSKGKEMNK